MYNVEEKIELLSFTVQCPSCSKPIQIHSPHIANHSEMNMEFLTKENQLLKEEVLNLRLANRQLTGIV